MFVKFLYSYMESEDSSDDLNDISLGREIMQAVKRNDLERPHTRQQRNVAFDSSTSDISDALYEMDDYLNEALEDDVDNEEDITPVSVLYFAAIFYYTFSAMSYNKRKEKRVV